MQVKLGVYAERTGAQNAISTRKAVYLYKVKPAENEHIKQLKWTDRADSLPCIDAIEPGAFNDLAELEYITTDGSKSDNSVPDAYCGLLWQHFATGSTLICCPQMFFQTPEHVDLPGVPPFAQNITLGAYSFYNVKFRLTTPEASGESLRQFCFTGRELPSISGIGDCAFANTNLTQLTLWPELCGMGMYAFMNCTDLKVVDCFSSKTSFGLTKLATGTFYNCNSLEEVTLPEGVVYIGTNVFANCRNLKCVRIPKSLSCICKDAFKECGDVRIVVPSDSHLRHVGIAEHVYLAGEPELATNKHRASDMQLEYYRNNYAIQNICSIAALGGNVRFEGANSLVKMPSILHKT